VVEAKMKKIPNVLKYPYLTGKNLIIVECLDENILDVNLAIPYHPGLSYWIEHKNSSLKVFLSQRLIYVDLDDYIVAGNPKFQYKILNYKQAMEAVEDFDLGEMKNFIAIMETFS
jgi:hypothetical protein